MLKCTSFDFEPMCTYNSRTIGFFAFNLMYCSYLRGKATVDVDFEQFCKFIVCAKLEILLKRSFKYYYTLSFFIMSI